MSTKIKNSQTAFAAFGGMLFGYDTGVIGGIMGMKDWLCTFGNHDPTVPIGCSISSSRQSLVVSILSAGTFFGALLAAPTADIVGRKYGIHVAVIVFCVGIAMQTAATAIGLFVAGRAIAGLGVGMLSMLIPMYQSECAPKWIRWVPADCVSASLMANRLITEVL
jgi:MFS transporter, SP family, sugar:H+ symporter